MKIKRFISASLILGLLLATACKREKITTMSDDDIAETMNGSVSESDGGAATDVSASARTADILNNSVFCGLTGDTAVTFTGPQGRYSWVGTWVWSVNCISGIPSSISLSNTGSASYDGTNFDFSSTFNGDFEITDLGNTTTAYNTNGTSERVGTGTTVIRNRKKEFSYTNHLVFTNVRVRKTDHTIASGTGTAHCVGTVVDGKDFDRTAAIVFNGDGTYTVTLDNGQVFMFNLQ